MRKEVKTTSIKKKRLDAGITQKELAERVGVDQSAVALWESGTGPKRSRLSEVAAVLRCTIAELLEDDEENTKEGG